MVCRDLGISCRIYVFEQHETETVRTNAALMRAFGAEVVPCGNSVAAGLLYYRDRRRFDPRVFFLYAGCSHIQETGAGPRGLRRNLPRARSVLGYALNQSLIFRTYSALLKGFARWSTRGSFFLRSIIDCMNSKLPETKMIGTSLFLSRIFL